MSRQFFWRLALAALTPQPPRVTEEIARSQRESEIWVVAHRSP
jgi:hypothetical protein